MRPGKPRVARAALSVAALLAAAPPAASLPADPGTDAQRAAGKTLYMEKCAQCHGEAGDGKGVGAEFFKPLPRDFTSGAFKIRSTGSGELPTDQDLKSIIKRGMPHTGMPAWPRFSEEELADLAYFIKTFNPDFADTANLTPPIEIRKAPAWSAKSAERGRKVFEENKCMDCHGRLGRGDGESGPTLEDDWGQKIRPADLTRRWTFRGGPTREDIYRTFMTGLNGTPMPSYANSIESEEDRWALVDYVHSLSPSDRAPYATVAVAEAVAKVDLGKGRDLFGSAKPALFPVVGQVIEGNRNFFPAAEDVEVRAVYDSADIAILVSWHDMSAERAGSNSPAVSGPAAAGDVSDAVAVQLPLNPLEGSAKPYFLFGDSRHPVELWFADLAQTSGRRFVGKGDGQLTPDGSYGFRSGYEDGQWWMAFVRKRSDGKRLSLEPGAFVPIAFSVWDGFRKETGSSRGVTSWYNLYLKPAGGTHPAVPAGKRAATVLGAGIALLLLVRWRMRAS